MSNFNVTVSAQEDHDITGLATVCLQWAQLTGGGVAQTFTGNATLNLASFEDIDWGDPGSAGDCVTGGLNSAIAGLHQSKDPGVTIFATITIASIPKEQWIGFILIQGITARTILSPDIGALAFVIGNLAGTLVNLGPNYTDGYEPITMFVFKISTDGNTFSIAYLTSIAPYPESSLLALF